MDFTRTLIIGNSGSGKSWLAKRLAAQLHVSWVDLDTLQWLSDEASIARPRGETLALARIAASEERWVIEGVYGWIVTELIHRATALIWLSVDDQACVANIRQREHRPEGDELLLALTDWASSYRQRRGSSSFAAHQRLFDDFAGSKRRLMDHDQVTKFLEIALP
jgi:adenylate kinase family enzyme